MSLEPLKEEVRCLLADADWTIRVVEQAVWIGESRLKAAGELAFLRRQKESLHERLRALEAPCDDSGRAVLGWLRDEAKLLESQLEQWAAHRLEPLRGSVAFERVGKGHSE